MLRRITKPVVYAAGPEVFNTNRDDYQEMLNWGSAHGFEVLHPRRHSHLPQSEIYQQCVEDAGRSDVVVLDVNDFRGKCADDGTCVELGIGKDSGAILLGHKEKKEDPIERFGPSRQVEHLHVDERGYFIEEGSDRNLMVIQSLHNMFYWF